MNTRFKQEARESVAVIDGPVRAKRFSPMPVEELAGRFQHFTTEQQRQAHADWLKEHAATLPF